MKIIKRKQRFGTFIAAVAFINNVTLCKNFPAKEPRSRQTNSSTVGFFPLKGGAGLHSKTSSTNALLDFFKKMSTNFSPAQSSKVKKAVANQSI